MISCSPPETAKLSIEMMSLYAPPGKFDYEKHLIDYCLKTTFEERFNKYAEAEFKNENDCLKMIVIWAKQEKTNPEGLLNWILTLPIKWRLQFSFLWLEYQSDQQDTLFYAAQAISDLQDNSNEELCQYLRSLSSTRQKQIRDMIPEPWKTDLFFSDQELETIVEVPTETETD
jgi:hypothetical protein